MKSITDQQLLHQYAQKRSDAAFAELVRRHVDFVHSSALRMVRDAHLAEEVTQDVFIALARNAFKLTAQPVVKTTVYADPDYDSSSEMSMNGASGNMFNNIQGALEQAIWAFKIDNHGQMPSDPSSIASYLNRPIDDVTIQKYLDEITDSDNINGNLPTAAIAALAPAFKAYAAANNGQLPQDPSALTPYLATPEQQAALHNLYQNTAPQK